MNKFENHPSPKINSTDPHEKEQITEWRENPLQRSISILDKIYYLRTQIQPPAHFERLE